LTTLVWNGIKLFPDSGHSTQYGMDMVKTHADRWKADVVISWLDAFSIPVELAKSLNWCAWAPVDSEPVMARNVPPLKACRWTMAPTRWSARMMQEAGLDPMYMPCAYDSESFFIKDGLIPSKREFGELIGRDLEDKFLVNVVSANAGGRKNYQAIFAAWKKFHAERPDSLLYLHTDITGYFSGGNDLVEMAKTYGVNDDSVFYVSQWEYSTGQLGEDYLNLVYNASDVHLNCCYGEGFGLPIMEAQAAGCPTIVPAFAAANEVGLHRKIVKGSLYATVPGAMQFFVDVDTVVEQLHEAYDDRFIVDRVHISKSTKPWEVKNVVREYWRPALERMAADVHKFAK
jgi:glycosyltransferase involved in cell wall biosynthesis